MVDGRVGWRPATAARPCAESLRAPLVAGRQPDRLPELRRAGSLRRLRRRCHGAGRATLLASRRRRHLRELVSEGRPDVVSRGIRDHYGLYVIDVATRAAALVALGAIAGAIFGIVKLFDDGDGNGPPAQTAAIEIGKPQLRGSNALFDVDLTVGGQRDRELRLVWTLWDADESRPVDEPGFEQQPVARFKPSADPFQRSFQAVVPSPSSGDSVFLRVELFGDDGDRLAFDDSQRLQLGGATR